MSPTEQRLMALEVANERRARVSRLKRALRSGEVVLIDVLTDPPGEMRHVPLVDVVRWSRGHGSNSGEWFRRMGHAAVRDGVNLMMPLGKASERTRLWVVEYAEWNLMTCGRRAAWRPSSSSDALKGKQG